MKISGTRPTGSTGAVRPTRPAGPARGVGAAAPTGSVQAADAVRIVGVPETEMTPRVQAAISQLMEEVSNLKRELEMSKRRIEELEREADEDTLMPVLNRRAFVREMARTKASVARYGTKASLIYIDMNNFKEINDVYGHAAGDAALLHVGEVLKSNVRAADTVGRIGGDEFGVILHRANEDQAQRRVEIVATMIENKPVVFDGKPLPMSIAFGVAEIHPDHDIEHTLANADKAMFEHKQSKAPSSRGTQPPKR